MDPAPFGGFLSAIYEAISGFVLPLAMVSASQSLPAGLPLGDEADPYPPVVARLVRAFVQYSRWPGNPATMRACVVGPADHADDLLAGKEVAAIGIEVVRRSLETVRAADCAVVYIGRLSLDDQRVVTARMKGEAVLTIAENDPACRSRAMFCLLFEARSLSFRLNIDAVSQSLVRVDPRVLLLADGDGA